MKALCLLVGTNPLPNYVVMKHLKDSYDKFFLIYSEENRNQRGTGIYAQKLQEVLDGLSGKIERWSLPDVSDSRSIYKHMSELFKKPGELDEIHLNYTGGTKAMAVHVYEFLKENYQEKFVYSYLDARNFELVVYEGTSKGAGKIRERCYLRKVGISIENLLKLHNCDNMALGKKIEFSAENKKNINFDFDKEELEIYKKIRTILSNSADRDILIEMFKNDSLEKMFAYLAEKNRRDSWDDLLDLIGEKDLKNFRGGKWLEFYIFHQLRETLGKKDIESFNLSLGMNLQARKKLPSPKGASQGGKDFEIDVFIIAGYQFIGISAATKTDKKACKLKGFEIAHRVRQIGGDESRAFLVTTLSPEVAKDVEDELFYETGSDSGKVKVFGIDDLADIGEEILREVGIIEQEF